MGYNNSKKAKQEFNDLIAEYRKGNYGLAKVQAGIAEWIVNHFAAGNPNDREQLNAIIKMLKDGPRFLSKKQFKKNHAFLTKIGPEGINHIYAAHAALDIQAFEQAKRESKQKAKAESIDQKRERLLREEFSDAFSHLCFAEPAEEELKHGVDAEDEEFVILEQPKLLDFESLKQRLEGAHDIQILPKEKARIAENMQQLPDEEKPDPTVASIFQKIETGALGIYNALRRTVSSQGQKIGLKDTVNPIAATQVAKDINMFSIHLANNHYLNELENLNELEKFYVMHGYLHAYMMSKQGELELLNSEDYALLTNIAPIIRALSKEEKTLKNEIDRKLGIKKEYDDHKEARDKPEEGAKVAPIPKATGATVDYNATYANYHNKLIERGVEPGALPKPFSLKPKARM